MTNEWRSPEDKLQVGESYAMKIIKISPLERKIGLSIRAVHIENYEPNYTNQGLVERDAGRCGRLRSFLCFELDSEPRARALGERFGKLIQVNSNRSGVEGSLSAMTKAELIEEVSRVSDLTKKHSEIIVDTVFKSIIDALHRGDKIELRVSVAFASDSGSLAKVGIQDGRTSRRACQEGTLLQAGQGAERAHQSVARSRARGSCRARIASGSNVSFPVAMTTVDEVYVPSHRLRFVTAASLFDGHDASINIIRRLLQARGVEVIHLGHNRSVGELVEAALEEDAQAIAVSSYQGGHCEYFRYLVDLLRERGAPHVRVFGGGGGVIVPREIRELESSGVTRIYSPEDGRKLGLAGIIDDMLRSSDAALTPVTANGDLSFLSTESVNGLARLITQVETSGRITPELAQALSKASSGHPAPVIGITGTGGAGKSSVTDELLRRLLRDGPELRVAVLSIDPTKRKTGGRCWAIGFV